MVVVLYRVYSSDDTKDCWIITHYTFYEVYDHTYRMTTYNARSFSDACKEPIQVEYDMT